MTVIFPVLVMSTTGLLGAAVSWATVHSVMVRLEVDTKSRPDDLERPLRIAFLGHGERNGRLLHLAVDRWDGHCSPDEKVRGLMLRVQRRGQNCY